MTTSRPWTVAIAEGLLAVGVAGASTTSAVFAWLFPSTTEAWAMPAAWALLFGAVLAGIRQRRAFARPLAMALFAAVAVYASRQLALQDVATTLPSGTALAARYAFTLGVTALAAWFGLSGRALAHFDRP